MSAIVCGAAAPSEPARLLHVDEIGPGVESITGFGRVAHTDEEGRHDGFCSGAVAAAGWVRSWRRMFKCSTTSNVSGSHQAPWIVI